MNEIPLDHVERLAFWTKYYAMQSGFEARHLTAWAKKVGETPFRTRAEADLDEAEQTLERSLAAIRESKSIIEAERKSAFLQAAE